MESVKKPKSEKIEQAREKDVERKNRERHAGVC